MINKFDWNNINVDKVTQEEVEFALKEAKECLDGTINYIYRLENKALLITGCLIILITAITGFIFTNENIKILFPLLILVGGFTISIFILFKAIVPKNKYINGNIPYEILKNEAIEHDYLYFLECILPSYQKGIEHNILINKKISNIIYSSIIITYTSIIAYWIMFIVVNFLL